MTENLPKFHTFDIEFNGFGPFTAAASAPMSATIATYVGMQGVFFSISYELDKNTTKHYRLRHMKPGDRLKLTYDGPSVDSGTSIDKIEIHDEPSNSFTLKKGCRIGFDITVGDEKRRLSHPEGGGMSIMISNVPSDHARFAVNAGNDEENWNWQQEDLYAGDSVDIEIVETDWCDPYPKVEKIITVSE